MKKIAIFIVALLVLGVFFTAIYPAYAGSKLVKFKIINKTDQNVYIQLDGDEFYYLTIMPETTQKFTVERDVYKRTTWACGYASVGTLDLSSQIKLNFTPCELTAPNQGEPTQEKVSLYDSPTGLKWRYQDK